MRMKLNKSSQLVLVSAAGLLTAALVTACSQITETKTIDFVYVASSKAAGADNYGEINIFEINSESGKMRQIPASPVPSGGRYPISEAAATDYSSLFVANHDDNTIVQFVIGTDGKLYSFNTVNTPGVFPVAIATSAANLFVVDTYQPLPSCSPASPCSGSIAVFPLTASNPTTPTAIGTAATNTSISAQYWPLTVAANPANVIVPTGVAVPPGGKFVFVSAYDSTALPHVGYIFAFAVGTGGALTPVAGSPFAAGAQPSAVTTDATGAYLYAPDFVNNKILGFSISAGVLAPLSGSPYPAGTAPSAIAVSPAYNYAFVTNSTDSNITVYSIANGALTRLGSYAVGLQPVAIGVDPSTARYVFTANFLGNNVSGYQLQKLDGSLLLSQGTPYPSNNQPTAVAAIPHNGTGGGIQ
jgi:6-phosphogluconolactonase (cycloisomerase 2 family)